MRDCRWYRDCFFTDGPTLEAFHVRTIDLSDAYDVSRKYIFAGNVVGVGA